MIRLLFLCLLLGGCTPADEGGEKELPTKYPDVPTMSVTDPDYGKF